MNDLSKIIVALDLTNVKEALEIVDKLGDEISFYKIGPVLFIQDGPNLIRELKRRGKRIFLDMKFHDIPNTVKEACVQAADYGVDMLTIHLSGGFSMARAAVQSTKLSETKIIGVTALTSLGKEDLERFGINESMKDFVFQLTVVALNASLHGIVCSPHETKYIRDYLKKESTDKQAKKIVENFIIINPGIRLESDEKNDQNRSATPKAAFEADADYLVIGRPITQAKDPKEKIEELKRHLNS